MGRAQQHCWPDDLRGVLSAQGRSRGTRTPTGPLRERPQLYSGKNEKVEANAGKRFVLGHVAKPESAQPPRALGSPRWDTARLPAAVLPFPQSWRVAGSGHGDYPPGRA